MHVDLIWVKLLQTARFKAETVCSPTYVIRNKMTFHINITEFLSGCRLTARSMKNSRHPRSTPSAMSSKNKCKDFLKLYIVDKKYIQMVKLLS